MAYATIAQVRERMGWTDGTNTELVARTTSALDAATTAIENHTGRVFTASTATRTFGATNTTVLRVPDLSAVSTLKTDTTGDGTFDTTITDYELDTIFPDGWAYDTIRLISDTFPVATSGRRRRVEINATWGWSAVPEPVVSACALIALQVANRPISALFGAQAVGDAGAAAMIIQRDPHISLMLDPYVRRGVG